MTKRKERNNFAAKCLVGEHDRPTKEERIILSGLIFRMHKQLKIVKFLQYRNYETLLMAKLQQNIEEIRQHLLVFKNSLLPLRLN